MMGQTQMFGAVHEVQNNRFFICEEAHVISGPYFVTEIMYRL